jgi:chorismate dehydratase
MSWKDVIGRVSFSNCDPIFDGMDPDWTILSAPPAWLTGHVMRRDCITAPIPSADYASNSDKLLLLPDIGIVSNGEVGSVLLFGKRSIENMRDIALPTDSSTSKVLLSWIVKNRGLDPKFIETGPDINAMLEKCDGALLIGDRAILASIANPDLVKMDLGAEWTRITGFPMVFGVFVARRDSPKDILLAAHSEMIKQVEKFENNQSWRASVISRTAKKLGLPEDRVGDYFRSEVRNKMSKDDIDGLLLFLKEACGMLEPPNWLISYSE